MNPLVGIFECKIDGKGRLMLPKDIQDELPKSEAAAVEKAEPEDNARDDKRTKPKAKVDRMAWYVVLFLDNQLLLMPKPSYHSWVDQLGNAVLPSEAEAEFKKELFRNSQKVVPDGQGRVLLPQRLLSKTKLRRDVVIVGQGFYLEINDRDEFRRQEAERGGLDAAAAKLRKAGVKLEPSALLRAGGAGPAGEPG